ncbi:MAG: hypothetical protein MJY87_03500 [Fibrobacter sp.]|nr:hypothetical protein [Fibrobacter sp.]
MMKRVLKFGSAVLGTALGVTMLACSDGGMAGTTFETENDIALTILNEDGSPASNARVLVRRMDYLAGSSSRDFDDTYGVAGESPVSATDTLAGIFNAVTDANGQVSIKADKKRMKATSYVIEARGEKNKAISRVSINETDSLYPVEIKLAPPGAVSGQVYLPNGVRTATVGVQGIDYFVQTDTLGNFVFESLPEGSFNVTGFVYNEQSYDVDGETQVFASKQNLGFTSTKVKSSKETEGVLIGKVAEPVDDTVKIPEYQFETFERGVASWYTSASRYASATLMLANADKGREGVVAHLTYKNDSLYNWALMGHAFSKMQDFSTMDSLVLWIRGSATADTQWVSISFDVLVDSTSEYKSGKAWAHRGVTAEWTRYVIVPSDFQDPVTDTNGGNIGWDEVKSHVTNFNIFGGGKSSEIWVDDIEIYGVKNFERP